MQKYHRRGGSLPCQDLDIAMKQACSSEIWGQARKLVGKDPAVKAFFGPLDAKHDGVEFETALTPTSVQQRQGGLVTWCEPPKGVASSRATGFCGIKVTITAVRYKQVGQLPVQGVEWP